METSDVVIAGAGIIGLSLALELATRGCQVTVLERGQSMAESSWAAAGMLAAQDPENPPALRELAQYSLALYPDFLARIGQLTGSTVPFRTTATLQGSRPGERFHHTGAARRIGDAELGRLVPGLDAGRRDFLLLDEASLDPRDLCSALPIAAQVAGVRLLHNSAVHQVTAGVAKSPLAIQTNSNTILADSFIDCTGAWARVPSPVRPFFPAIAPRKGQMLTIFQSNAEPLRHVVRTPELYLVPRGDRRIVIGATVESAGFDKTLDPAAIAALHRSAAALYPPIAGAEVLSSWAGLRPGSADDLPLIGNAGHPRCWLASGHFRNGILLAPGTARALADAISGKNAEVDLGPFTPGRFHPLQSDGAPASDNAPTAAL